MNTLQEAFHNVDRANSDLLISVCLIYVSVLYLLSTVYFLGPGTAGGTIPVMEGGHDKQPLLRASPQSFNKQRQRYRHKSATVKSDILHCTATMHGVILYCIVFSLQLFQNSCMMQRTPGTNTVKCQIVSRGGNFCLNSR